MKALSDLIQEKKEDLHIQQIMAKPMTSDDASWIRAKNHLDSLSKDYMQLFTDNLNSNVFSVEKKYYGKYTNISFTKSFETHTIRLEVFEDQNKIVKRVTYFATKKDIPSTTYYRDIVGILFGKMQHER